MTKARSESAIVSGVTPASVGDGTLLPSRIVIAGNGQDRTPKSILRAYPPRHEIELFGCRYLTTDLYFDDALRFLVTYVIPAGAPRTAYARIVYKDSSLVWRVASHFIHDEDEYWIGKGAVRVRQSGQHVIEETAEETTNLPFEIQRALDAVSRNSKATRDDRAVELFLREAPTGRLRPYADFTRPRDLAERRGAINGGRNVARFERRGDPTSLRFTRGFEPDLSRGTPGQPGGVVEHWWTKSRFFGGDLVKVRVLSTNRQAQYLFFASPTHVWVNPPQALSTELSTYGVRVSDVLADDDLSIPGYEYHEDDMSQIPDRFAGDPHPDDPHRADANPWLSKLPVITEFSARVLPHLRRSLSRSRKR